MVPYIMLPSIIAVINAYPRFDAVFDPVALEMRMAVRKYPGIRPMADDLNAKTLPAEDLALIILTGTAETNDPAQYKKNMGLLGQLAKHSKLGSVPVLFLGYRGDNNLSEACEGCGAAYLDLPVRKSALIERIKALTPRPPLPKGEGEFGKKSPGREPLSLRERGAAEPGVREDKIKTESERRLATVMFADISGFTAMSEKMDPEEVTAVMNGCFEMLGEHIEAHGGHIDKFIGDCVMVCFGVPRALENAPLRAVNTAIEIRNRLYQFNNEKNLGIPLDIHIGINTGMVVSGTVGSTGRKDYTVMGDAVNLASRIEGASEKGQILVGPDTYRATQEDFEYRTLPPVTLKGKADPVPVYEVLSTKEASARRARTGARVPPRKKKGAAAGPDRMIFSEMVGRDEEMNELRHAVTGLVRGKGGIVSVIGEAGIGKSRLMAELKSDPAMKQVTLLEGQALSMGRTLSFHPIIDMLKNWAGISEEDQEGAQLAKLDRAVRAVHPDEADEIVPFVGTMMGMKLTGQFAERVKGIEGEGLEKLIFKNVRALLIRGAELRPMIIRVEDLHWADTSSIELLISLFRLARDHRIMFLNFFRPNYPDTGDRVAKACREEYSCALTPASGAPLSRGERGSVGENLSQGLPSPSGRGAGGEGGISSSIYTEILVQPLDGKESATLISNLLNIRGLPQSLRDQITDRAGGNPFFIEEVVRSLIDEGAVVRKGDSFAVTDRIHEVKVPLTINEVLMSRIDRLDEETRSLIRTASVIGRYFFYKIIAQVAQNISDIDRRLSYLEDIQLIRERKRMDELEYLFKHALAQEAAYDSILIQKRKELHLHVAQAIESVFAGRLHEFYGMLAYHYSMGENLDRAEEYMLRAGEEAMKASASSEALKYFIDAMAVYRGIYGNRADASKIALIERNIADLYHQKGMGQDAVEYYYRVLSYYGIKRPVEWAFWIKSTVSLIALLIRLVIPFFKPFNGKKIPDERVKEIVSLKTKQGFAFFTFNEGRSALDAAYSSRIFNNYDLTLFDMKISMPALGYLIAVYAWSGISLKAGSRLIQLIDQTFGISKARLIPEFSSTEVMLLLFSGRWNDIVQYSEKYIIDQGSQLNHIHDWTNFIYFYALYKLEVGELKFAITIIEKIRELGDIYDNEYSMALWYKIHARVLYKKRELPQSLIETNTGIDFISSFGHPDYVGFLYALKARLLSIMENPGGMAEALSHAEKQFSNAIIVSPYYRCMYTIGWWSLHYRNYNESLRKNEKKAAKKHIRAMKKWAHKAVHYSKKCATDRTEAYRIMGINLWLSGKPEKAFAWWKKSIYTGERLSAKLELSRTYFEVGKRMLNVTSPTPTLPLNKGEGAGGGRGIIKRLGLSPEEYLAKAEAMFREMDLQWDLAELEKVRENYT